MTAAAEPACHGQTLQRFARAERRRRAWDGLLDDAYAYALPSHDAAPGAGVGPEIFDNTAVRAVQWRKARLHGHLFPPFREWMDFDAAANAAIPEGERENFSAYAAEIRSRFHAAIDASNFHIEIGPALGDALVSTGALMIHEGSFSSPLRFEAVPARELIPEENAEGALTTMFRKRRLAVRDISALWPDARLTPEMTRLAREAPDTSMELIEAVMADRPGGPARYEIWAHAQPGADGENLLATRYYAASPLVAFRMDKAPGEWMGRGPVINVLADVKTANKVVELILKNASIAVTGIWQAEDDGVLNPANIRLTPGAIIPKAVGSAGLTPLDAPGKFDVSQVVLERLQESIRRGVMGPELPATGDGVRTAYEIDARRQEFAAIDLPMSLRLLSELDQPLARRVLSILSGPAMIGSPYHIEPFMADGEAIRPRPASPLVRLQEAAQAAESHLAYQAATQDFPDILDSVVDRTGYLRYHLRKLGFPSDFLISGEAAMPDMAEAAPE